ncbi:MAG: hypothetical protein JW806_10095 [Sedimentisphaerales bacterium]|nr:hypothetical protein [Sedimentisphaerales bacterium]
MSNKNNNQKDNFDKLLADALKQYRQPVPADFPKKMLSRLEQFEQTQALKKVIWQERALWIAFISFPVMLILSLWMFPNLLSISRQWPSELYPLIMHSAEVFVQQWKLWAGYAILILAITYALYDTAPATS